MSLDNPAAASPTGTSRLYKDIATTLIESSALYAVSSLWVIGPFVAGSSTVGIFLPILSEIQIRAFPRLGPSDWLPDAAVGQTGYSTTPHHSAARYSDSGAGFRAIVLSPEIPVHSASKVEGS